MNINEKAKKRHSNPIAAIRRICKDIARQCGFNLDQVGTIQIMRKPPNSTDQHWHIDTSLETRDKCMENGCPLENAVIALSSGINSTEVVDGAIINGDDDSFSGGTRTGAHPMEIGEVHYFDGTQPHRGVGNETDNYAYSIFVSLKNKHVENTDYVTFLKESSQPSSPTSNPAPPPSPPTSNPDSSAPSTPNPYSSTPNPAPKRIIDSDPEDDDVFTKERENLTFGDEEFNVGDDDADADERPAKGKYRYWCPDDHGGQQLFIAIRRQIFTKETVESVNKHMFKPKTWKTWRIEAEKLLPDDHFYMEFIKDELYNTKQVAARHRTGHRLAAFEAMACQCGYELDEKTDKWTYVENDVQEIHVVK